LFVCCFFVCSSIFGDELSHEITHRASNQFGNTDVVHAAYLGALRMFPILHVCVHFLSLYIFFDSMLLILFSFHIGVFFFFGFGIGFGFLLLILIVIDWSDFVTVWLDYSWMMSG
jgi:hypothetical protein